MKLKQKYTGGKRAGRAVLRTVVVTGKLYPADKSGLRHKNFEKGGIYNP